MNKDLEKRMYILVPYNISDIQKGIQGGHAALEYANEYKNDPQYIDFVENWKTWIILNGGTTNNDFGLRRGTLNLELDKIIEFNNKNPDNIIKYSTFNETDLNDALTAICLVVDERVFNKEKYPNLREWKFDNLDDFDQPDEILLETYFNATDLDSKTHFLKELLNSELPTHARSDGMGFGGHRLT